MRMPPLLADFIYNRVCELKCEKFLTRPCPAKSYGKQKGYRLWKRYPFNNFSSHNYFARLFSRIISDRSSCQDGNLFDTELQKIFS